MNKLSKMKKIRLVVGALLPVPIAFMLHSFPVSGWECFPEALPHAAIAHVRVQ